MTIPREPGRAAGAAQADPGRPEASSAPSAPAGGAARHLPLLPVGAAFLLLTALALLVVNVGATFGDGRDVAGLTDAFDPWVRYDAGWYHYIATEGYFYRPGEQSAVAFFPTYPLLMRALSEMTGVYLAGVILTVLAGLASVLLLTRWCRTRLSRASTATAVALLLVYPYSLYLYGAVYADALFLACALGAFLLLERGHPWLAGLVGALATAGRPVGVAVAVGLTVRAVELARQRALAARGEDADAGPPPAADSLLTRGRAAARTALSSLRFVRPSDAGVLLSAVGLLGYMAYQWVSFDTPIAFVLTESAPGWDQGTGPKVLLKAAFVGAMVDGDQSLAEKLRLVVPALLCLATLLLLPRIQRRFGWGYAAYTAIVVAIPIVGTKDFMGSGRYLLVAFPLFAVVGELLAEHWPRRVRLIALPVSGLMLLVAVAAYGQGFEVS